MHDLVHRLGLGFDVFGSVELRGVADAWRLWRIDGAVRGAGTAEAPLAWMPTPGLAAPMRRSDRAVEVVATTPSILRQVARLAPATDRRSARCVEPQHVRAPFTTHGRCQQNVP